MHLRFKSRLVLSAVLALLAMYLAYAFLVKARQKENIVVLKHTVEPYTRITRDMLQLKEINARDKTEYFPAAVTDMDELDGAITRVRLDGNKPIEKTEDKFVMDSEMAMALNSQGGVDDAYFIPYDKRLICVNVDNTGSINKRIKSGDFVDVIFTSRDEATGGIFSNMILQHLQVYSVDMGEKSQDLSGPGKETIDVLLLATPEECLKLCVSKRNGAIDLVLNPLKGETKGIEPVNIFEFSEEKPQTKSEKLDALEAIIRQEDISDIVKEELINNIEKERQIETIKSAIEASILSRGKKDALLAQLE